MTPFANEVLGLTESLMRARSVTPEDAGCQNMMVRYLEPLGFATEFINAGPVTNLWASKHFGSEGPHIILAGHTDVVPTGPLDAWATDPFEPTIQDGYLYGRGAADMKASLAAMLVACKHLEASQGTVSLLITSDEEGDAIHGTRHVVQTLADRGVMPDFCLVGEPSSDAQLGDVVRCGRRGSLNGQITIRGVQGHVAYPDKAENPIHTSLSALSNLTSKVWDDGDAYFPPTTFQISNLNSGTGATNVIPGELELLCNFRYNTTHTADALIAACEQALTTTGLTFDSSWRVSGEPFLTERGTLTDAVSGAIQSVMGHAPELSTGGGTSDGRFIAPWHGKHQVDVVELGPRNATIHQVDESTPVAELAPLAHIYQHILTTLLH